MGPDLHSLELGGCNLTWILSTKTEALPYKRRKKQKEGFWLGESTNRLAFYDCPVHPFTTIDCTRSMGWAWYKAKSWQVESKNLTWTMQVSM